MIRADADDINKLDRFEQLIAKSTKGLIWWVEQILMPTGENCGYVNAQPPAKASNSATF